MVWLIVYSSRITFLHDEPLSYCIIFDLLCRVNGEVL